VCRVFGGALTGPLFGVGGTTTTTAATMMTTLTPTTSHSTTSATPLPTTTSEAMTTATMRAESAMARFAFGSAYMLACDRIDYRLFVSVISNGPGCHVKTFAFFRACWPTLPRKSDVSSTIGELKCRRSVVTVFPRFLSTGTSVLGLGDVLVPGLFLAFLRRVDVDMYPGKSSTLIVFVWIAASRQLCAKGAFFRGYFFVGMVAYMLGIILTFVIATVVRNGQPALLYLIPIIHTTIVIVARWRGVNALIFVCARCSVHCYHHKPQVNYASCGRARQSTPQGRQHRRTRHARRLCR
jgi:hypothetical protein